MSKSSESKTSSSLASDSNVVDATEKSTTWLQLLFRIFLVLLTLFLIFCAVGYNLPRDYSVAVSTTIDAPPEEIYPLLVNLDRWKEWSPAWDFAKNSQIESVFFNQDRKGVTWRHKSRGVTSTWISGAKLNREITMSLDDEAVADLEMETHIELKPFGENQTELTWSSDSRLPRTPLMSGVFYGWGGWLFYTDGLRKQYEKDLARLKEVCEAKE